MLVQFLNGVAGSGTGQQTLSGSGTGQGSRVGQNIYMYTRGRLECMLTYIPLNVVHARGDRVRVQAKIGHAAEVSVAVEVIETAVPNVPAEGRGTEGEASI